MAKLHSDRPVLTYDDAEFGALLGRVLSPARPLQSAEFLRGRHQQLAEIKQALYQPGRHILIHGLRGVGKSSLAQTAAYALAREQDPILVGCDRHSTFQSIVREIFDEVDRRDPRLRQRASEVSGSFSRFGLTFGGKVQEVKGAAELPASTNDAVRLVQYLCEVCASAPVIVIDEFDLVEDRDEQERFATFIKLVSDKHVNAKFIFCGIGESVDAIMSAHGSADRYFHTVGLGQLPWEAREEIITTAADAVGVDVDRDTSIRIARISDGFPHYVHFLSEKLFWQVFYKKSDGVATPNDFGEAMLAASQSMEMRLRAPYEKATRKYNNDYETVLWAVADGHELIRPSKEIFASYETMMRQLSDEPLDRAKFNQRLNSLKKTSHAAILTGSRAGWYEFTEKMVRGYVRLRAETAGVELEVDHPRIQRSRGT
ncbi:MULTISPECIES: AAA family ATPase [unclassified Roseovarius]|uniref:AAA family ATPase n=1 Tax=unclassified Roseovarius TaxID=2614913 RepID=UPI00273D1D22|nr:AAA family ATPase [Roseovarius sp. MMSF_3350]